MKIDKAINILDRYQVEGEAPCGGALDDALKLGIEALKVIKKIRHYPFPDEILKLPGETPKEAKDEK